MLSLGGFVHLLIILSTYPHLKHLRGVPSVRFLSESPAARYFSLSFLVFLKIFSAEWLVPPKMFFFKTRFALLLFLQQPEVLSRDK